MKISDVPFFQQDTSYTCGPASLQMILKFLGDFKSEAALAKETHAKKNEGTKHAGILEAARREGFVCHSKSEATIAEIKEALNSDLPVIVNYIEPSENIGHYSVVVGIEKGEIIMNDPWDGKNFKLSEREFLSRWHDGYEGKERWMAVVSKKR